MCRRGVMAVMMIVRGLAGPALTSHAASMATPMPIMEHHVDHQSACSPSEACEADNALCEFVCFGLARLAMPPTADAPVPIDPAHHTLPRNAREVAGLAAAIDHPPKPGFP